MEKNPYETEWRVEGNHWWFSGRRKLLQILFPLKELGNRGLAVDVGCGVGSNLYALRSWSINVVGLDRSMDNLLLAKGKVAAELVNGDLVALPFRSKSIGAILAMDVLEHLENDQIGIHELWRVLKPGGILFLTVPAFNFLRGIQDVATGHKRRYSLPEIRRKLEKWNFEILRCSYFNFFLFFPILLGRLTIRFFNVHVKTENEVNAPGINFLLKTIFSMEPHLLKYISFPFGVSIFCIIRKGKDCDGGEASRTEH